MKMKYETDRLVLQVLTDAAADRVLKFYQNNQEVFEPYEVERSKNFYTEQYHKTLLQCEYNLAIKQSAVRFWVSEKTEPERIIGTVSLQGIRYDFFALPYWAINLTGNSGGAAMQGRVSGSVWRLLLWK